jgi:subfamily B ATP-binding cassette protein MsbA
MSVFFLSKYLFQQSKWQFLIVIFLLILSSVFELIGIAAFLPLLDTLMKGDTFEQGFAKNIMVFIGLENAKVSDFLLIIVIVITARTILVYLSRILMGRAAVNLEHKLRVTMFEKLLDAKWSYFSGKRAGTISNIMTAEVYKAGLCVTSFLYFFVAMTMAIIFLIATAFINFQSFIVLILLCLPMIFVVIAIQKRTKKAATERIDESNNFNSNLIEYLGNIKFMKASSSGEFELKRFKKNAANLTKYQNKVVDYNALTNALPDGLGVIFITVLIMIIYYLNIGQNSDFIYFMIVAFRGQRFLGDAQTKFQHVVGYLPSFSSCMDILGDIDQFQEDKSGLNLNKADFKNEIKFENVSFGFKDKKILDCVNMKFIKNKTIAIVGESGGGKTTLVDLLVGLMPPDSGRILIDDQSLWDLNVYDWRQKISYVSQDCTIFNGTIRENILYNQNDVDDDYFHKILKAVEIEKILTSHGDNLETILDDNGRNLSGGQKQRIGLARALIKGSDILILDEATSALDSISEKNIIESILAFEKKITVIIITHRLSAVKNSDKIYVFKNGSIIQEGNYLSLSAQNGAFKDLENAGIIQD